MTDLLMETCLDKEQLEFTKTIKQSADNLLVIINDILDFSKIKAGKLMIEQINFRPVEILSGVEKIFRQKLIHQGLKFNCRVDSNIPDVICGDPYRLNQVLVNLVGNAIKFTRTGTISIDVRAGESDKTGVMLLFSVTDTGIGINADKVADIFQSFTQASPDITRKYGGSGLGLAICRQLLELQGGDIKVTSEAGKGSCFSFNIYYRYQNIAIAEAALQKETVNKDILAGRRFLIAEDNRINQKLIVKVIEKGGGFADAVNNGAEAIAKLKAGIQYDIIIMDLQMPEMDGYKATRYIRNELSMKIPIIAMTATAMKGEKIKCLELGMNEYLSKPFAFDDFYQSVYNVLPNWLQNAETKDAIAQIKNTPSLFNLSFLEEMEDDAYTIDILQSFLKHTPAELDKLLNAVSRKKYETVTEIAHKLKGSTGLLQISAMCGLLKSIEEGSRIANTGLQSMVNDLINIYPPIEKALIKHLELMAERGKTF